MKIMGKRVWLSHIMHRNCWHQTYSHEKPLHCRFSSVKTLKVTCCSCWRELPLCLLWEWLVDAKNSTNKLSAPHFIILLEAYFLFCSLVFCTNKVLTPPHFATFFPPSSFPFTPAILFSDLCKLRLSKWLCFWISSSLPCAICQKSVLNISLSWKSKPWLYHLQVTGSFPEPSLQPQSCIYSLELSSITTYDTRTSLKILFIHFLLWFSQLCEVVRN